MLSDHLPWGWSFLSMALCVCLARPVLLRRPKELAGMPLLQGPELRHAAPENVLRLVGDSVVREGEFKLRQRRDIPS